MQGRPIKSPFQNVNKKPKPAVVDLTGLIAKMSELEQAIADVGSLKDEMMSEHKNVINDFNAKHEAKLKELDFVMNQVLQIQKGEPGKDAEPVDTKALVSEILSKIPKPKDGESPDLMEVAKVAAKFVKVPEVKIPEVNIPEVKIDHEEIANEVIDMFEKGKKKLSTKYFGDFKDGLEQYLRPIRSLAAGFRGGGDVVTAGTNVTITTDANGRKVINAQGGSSGFTMLTATETPNGILTVFTFSLASAQPSFIVVDNVWMQATTKAGTVNWTWNAGLKQATMTIPPSDDIFGIV